MPSPFPGMNPFLEQETVWHDFHERFCPLVAELLTAQVRPHYIVKIDEHIYIHEMPESGRRFLGRGDVGLVPSGKKAGSSVATAVLEAPAQVRLPAVDFESLSFVEIRDRTNKQLVTVIEFLSPSNKNSGPDREQHIAERAQILASPVHFVEIDLLRGGPRLPLEELGPCAYYALVSRVEDRPKAGIWPIPIRGTLPVIPIPLQVPHPDAKLDLQQVVHRLYDAAGYEDYIYQGQPSPPLTPEDAAWAAQFVPTNP